MEKQQNRHIPRVGAVLIVALAVCGASARAEIAVSPGSLSENERAAMEVILNGLLAPSSDAELKQIVFNAIDGLGDAASAANVVRAVKHRAGEKLQTFESLLLSRCLARAIEGVIYCKLAALQSLADYDPTSTVKRPNSRNGRSYGGLDGYSGRVRVDGDDGAAKGGFFGSTGSNTSSPHDWPSAGEGSTSSRRRIAHNPTDPSSPNGPTPRPPLTIPAPMAGAGLPALALALLLATFFARKA